jgi:hypothetical protein
MLADIKPSSDSLAAIVSGILLQDIDSQPFKIDNEEPPAHSIGDGTPLLDLWLTIV